MTRAFYNENDPKAAAWLRELVAGGDGGARWADAPDGFWRDADWLFCRDGTWRPVEPGLEPLVDGAAARVGRLRGYGNAIVPQVAAAFIEAVREARNA